jgi:hypothetical protein
MNTTKYEICHFRANSAISADILRRNIEDYLKEDEDRSEPVLFSSPLLSSFPPLAARDGCIPIASSTSPTAAASAVARINLTTHRPTPTSFTATVVTFFGIAMSIWLEDPIQC